MVMKKLFICVVLFLQLFSLTSTVHAFSIHEDPQYVVMNFSTINEFNWAAPEEEWRETIKPAVLKEIHDFTTALPKGTTNRKLAWSTLMEYMNFPLDTPSESSPYAIKMRRILDISEEEDLPVFIPLNGFQWWDNLPELYNWWDPDGTHTSQKFFERQKNPADFKQRFIKGYNPDNKWNVEWQSYTTPMRLNYRNWGSGGFLLAPPPNLLAHNRSSLTYRGVQEARLKVIEQEIIKKINVWEAEEKSYLFAGITIGTEVSLNASTLPRDEFEPYGYRGIQDLECGSDLPTCGTNEHWTAKEVQADRQAVVNSYLTDLTRLSVNLGISKQRIYTHVWSEANPGEAHYENYAASAFTLYARPGMSFYGYAEDPLSLANWKKALHASGNPPWGAVEYSAPPVKQTWMNGLHNIFNNPTTQGKIVTIYNWDGHKGTPAIEALKDFLNESPSLPSCPLPEVKPTVENYARDPHQLTWEYMSDIQDLPSFTPTIHVYKGIRIREGQAVTTQDIVDGSQSFSLNDLDPGNYTGYVEIKGCANQYTRQSEPRIFTIFPKEIQETTPFWVKWFL
jgi:hypothetical protein